ncbi:MAG: deoxyribodipyrimidine photo-lyase [Daejeonella sp.]|uniref:cryptochrome/photolyase family protein n=1 Tax=Daejeonella sp. TaxID=2805397 RepID=UPI002734632C|nr:deoxyribodipyrimidine photo-lyase [Daejeonella sp.]MDP3468203.1 deoxyribodipyrimidine photo-lyase [Daejeonella sp.]
MRQELSICWLRRDLRLNDHAALYHALMSNYPVLVIFIFDPEILDKLPDINDKRLSFIHHQLNKLNDELIINGSSLLVKHDQVIPAFEKLSKQFNLKEVYTNHDYEPYAIDRDKKVAEFLSGNGISFFTFKDQVIFEKTDIMKSDGSPYTVFTPYSRRWREALSKLEIPEYPSERYLSKCIQLEPLTIPELEDIGFKTSKVILPGIHIEEELIRNYHLTRNLPSVVGTSQVSVHLRFGTISVRHLVKLGIQWNEHWLNELIWREFFMMILFHYPHVVNNSFKKKYDQIQWINNEKEFESWCRGETGYPFVDAGMRQLNETGLMHNRVRMIVASFLCKHLLIDWRWGEAYFAGKLFDYELSSNNGNWQWASGSGCDSAPYFRIFNPTAQTLKFDPKLIYIKTWIRDFKMDYMMPIVQHEFARKRALETYKRAVNETFNN